MTRPALAREGEIRFDDYNYVVINTSGGKDSQAMMDVVYEKAVRERYPLSRVVAVHADLGRVEWEGVAELAEEHARHYGIAFHKVSRPQGDLLVQIEQRGKWPSPQQRYCTSDHKRGQITKVVTGLDRQLRTVGGRVRRDMRTTYLNCMGMRAQESSARKKMEAIRPNKTMTTKSRTVTDWLPIHDWKVEDVWARIRGAGTRHHWAYDKGMPRLSCCFCIFAPKPALAIAARLNPGLFKEYVALEEKMGHTFSFNFSLADVKREMEAGVYNAGSDITDEWNM